MEATRVTRRGGDQTGRGQSFLDLQQNISVVAAQCRLGRAGLGHADRRDRGSVDPFTEGCPEVSAPAPPAPVRCATTDLLHLYCNRPAPPPDILPQRTDLQRNGLSIVESGNYLTSKRPTTLSNSPSLRRKALISAVLIRVTFRGGSWMLPNYRLESSGLLRAWTTIGRANQSKLSAR